MSSYTEIVEKLGFKKKYKNSIQKIREYSEDSNIIGYYHSGWGKILREKKSMEGEDFFFLWKTIGISSDRYCHEPFAYYIGPKANIKEIEAEVLKLTRISTTTIIEKILNEKDFSTGEVNFFGQQKGDFMNFWKKHEINQLEKGKTTFLERHGFCKDRDVIRFYLEGGYEDLPFRLREEEGRTILYTDSRCEIKYVATIPKNYEERLNQI